MSELPMFKPNLLASLTNERRLGWQLCSEDLADLEPDLRRRMILELAWRTRKDLSPLLYPHSQSRMYWGIHGWKELHPKRAGPWVLNCHRRLGKTYLMTILGLERCLGSPKQIVRYGAPMISQCKEFVEPVIGEILATCPTDLLPIERNTDNGREWIFEHENGDSRFVLIGCGEQADAHRGKASDMILLDECRDIARLDYVVKIVFGYHLHRRTNPLMVFASTPPESMEHSFTSMFIPEAIGRGTYAMENAETNEDYTEEDDAFIVDMVGGRDTIGYRREALCELFSNPENLIIPEFVEMEAAGKLGLVVVKDHPRPTHFYPFTSIDGGFVDYTGVLFGYIDFRNQWLVVESELWARQKNSEEWSTLIKAEEKRLYGSNINQPVRFGDIPRQQQADMISMLRFPVLIPEKFDKQASIASLRTSIASGRVKIFDKCQSLCYQLRNGGYATNRKDFVRTDRLGHCDLIDALAYLHRSAYWGSNPFPPEFLDIFGHRINLESDRGEELEVISREEIRLDG